MTFGLVCKPKTISDERICEHGNLVTPMLFPYEPEQFWKSIREIIREEVYNAEKQQPVSPTSETPGLTYKPLYKITEVCAISRKSKNLKIPKRM